MAKSVKIANPVYDTVFKLLMQDLRITKFLIGIISDNKYKSGTIYAAFVVSQTDYLAYGQAMPDRSFNTTAIR